MSTTVSKNSQVKLLLKQLKLKRKVKIHMSEQVWNQVSYLCGKISSVEWSGILFYEVKGEVSDIANMEIVLKHILPMDKGSGGATNYSFDEEYVNFRMEHPEGLNWLAGHIHSHNNMGAYFSGTDDSEIHDNSEFHNYYLSIVVNNRMEVVGKLGFRGKSESKMTYICETGIKDKTYSIPVNMDEEVLFVREAEIILPERKAVEESFVKRVDEIIKNAIPAVTTYGGGGKMGYNYNQSGHNSYTKKGKDKDRSKKDIGGWDDTKLYYGSEQLVNDHPPSPYDEDDIDDFSIYWLTLGMPEEAGDDQDTAIYQLGQKISEGSGDFVMNLILSNARTMYYRFFQEVIFEEMVLVFERILDDIDSYSGEYEQEIHTIVLPAMTVFTDRLNGNDVKKENKKVKNLVKAKGAKS